MTNLLEETKAILERNGKTLKDIRWVGNQYFLIDLANMEKTFDVDYDSGFGMTEIAEDLLVVGDDWWLERHEYDGSEWWEFKTLPKKPTRTIKSVKNLRRAVWSEFVEFYDE